MDGILFASGRSIGRTVKIEASLLDIVPTVLHILDIPTPRDCDGHCLKQIFVEGSEPAKRALDYADSKSHEEVEFKWSPEDEKAVEERLRGLGYMA
jgi:arylsulfatase A-like enzyme